MLCYETFFGYKVSHPAETKSFQE